MKYEKKKHDRKEKIAKDQNIMQPGVGRWGGGRREDTQYHNICSHHIWQKDQENHSFLHIFR